jgi:hypothetical protein
MLFSTYRVDFGPGPMYPDSVAADHKILVTRITNAALNSLRLYVRTRYNKYIHT